MQPTAPSHLSESRMKALKRQRGLVDIPDADYPDEPCVTLATLPLGPHAPNKAEASLLRRICATTGLTPTQVRERKVYRQQLAKAGRSPNEAKPGAQDRDMKWFLTRVRGVTKAAPWTAEYREVFIRTWDTLAPYSRLRLALRQTSGAQAYARFAAERGYRLPDDSPRAA